MFTLYVYSDVYVYTVCIFTSVYQVILVIITELPDVQMHMFTLHVHSGEHTQIELPDR